MTNIQPPVPKSVTPDSFSGGQSFPSAQGSVPDFAAILARANESQAGAAGTEFGGPKDPPPVALAIAQVFDAYGFFPAGTIAAPPPRNDVHDPTAAGIPRAVSTSEVTPPALNHVRSEPVTPAEPQSQQSSQKSDPAPAPANETAPADGSERIPQSDRIRGLIDRIDRQLARGPGLRMEPLHLRQADQRHTPIGTRHDRPATTNHVQASRPDRPAHEPDATRQERLLFRIEEHVVELVGRLGDLSEDEKQQLIDALDAVLADYGLSLGSATLNGRPIARSPAPGGL